jgi:hypothetical protein
VPLNINEEKQDFLCETFQCQKGSLPFTYLGLPLGTTKTNIEHFIPLVQKVEKRFTCTSTSTFLSSALFTWLISHQPAVLFSHNNQPPATSQQYSSLRTNQHQPSATSQPNRL